MLLPRVLGRQAHYDHGLSSIGRQAVSDEPDQLEAVHSSGPLMNDHVALSGRPGLADAYRTS